LHRKKLNVLKPISTGHSSPAKKTTEKTIPLLASDAETLLSGFLRLG
jgi:hypothetical protein